MRSGHLRSSRVLFAVLILTLGMNACSTRVQPTVEPVAATSPTPTPLPTSTPTPTGAEITFSVTLLQKPPAPQKIYVDLLDEVTGLGINPDRHVMKKGQDDQHYTARVLVPAGSTLKYRYSRDGKPAPVEYNCAGQQVRYRLFLAGGTDTVPDVVCGWSDQEPAQDAYGRITGTVTDAQSGQPVPDILVSAGGISTLTASDGSYLLENLPAGTHNLVAYSLDGTYQAYQQGAVVAANSATPGPLKMAAAKKINVEFRVTAPKENAQGLPVRMVGNLLQLGNTFSDLSGGMSTVAFRAPLLGLKKDGSYSIKLHLPAGFDLRYKYSLGDGFWNGELTPDGLFHTRQLILPDHDLVIEDTIAAWQVKGSAPVNFSVTAPASTPAGNTVSIQFSPFGWTEPLPMWPLGENQWYYILYNPQNLVKTAAYRYCRNEQCGIADDAATPGPDAAGFAFKNSGQPQMFNDPIQEWIGVEADQKALPEDKPLVTRKGIFWTGVEIQPNYQPSWLPHFSQAFKEIHQTNAGWVVLTPSWQITSANPPVLQALPGQTARWSELTGLLAQAQQNQLHVALYPSISGGIPPQQLWHQAHLDADWWDRWFESYRTFVLNFADLAKAGGAEALILGGDDLAPMLPNGTLSDGQPSNVPPDSAARWEALIAEVRGRFNGQLLWAVSYNSGKLAPLPEFTASFDQIYLLWSAPLAAKDGAAEKDQIKTLTTALKKDILPVKKRFNKPVLIAAGYPSVSGAVTGCIKSGETCLPFDTFNQPFVPIHGFTTDLAGQASIYRVILKVICRQDYGWISGLIVRGYYPAAAIADASMSIRGKPSEHTLAEWFAAILENEK